jgi:hypothetical protein
MVVVLGDLVVGVVVWFRGPLVCFSVALRDPA